jgi:septum site-determining protein MinC
MIQRNIRVVEARSLEEVKKIVKSKYIELVKNNYFLLEEPNEEIENYLKDNGLKYLVKNGKGCNGELKIVEKIVEEIKEVKVQKNSIIYDRIIRSGEEIKSSEDLIFLKRINSGAKIVGSGNILILDENEGFVVCRGNFLVVRKNKKGTIIFKEENIGEVEEITFFGENVQKVIK